MPALSAASPQLCHTALLVIGRSRPLAATKLLDSHYRSDRGTCGFVLTIQPAILRVFSAEVRRSEAVTLCDPVMQVFDGLGG